MAKMIRLKTFDGDRCLVDVDDIVRVVGLPHFTRVKTKHGSFDVVQSVSKIIDLIEEAGGKCCG